MMRKINKIFFMASVLLLLNHVGARALILSGVDTITYPEFGFDFINQTACTTFIYQSSYNCYNHFKFYWYGVTKQFALNSDGYGYQAGKTNLDSLKSAPHDSIFSKLSLHIDSLPQDSLRYFNGNCYWIKSGTDPRDGFRYYPKIKILSFRVLDSASHKVEMVFLWAFNVNGARTCVTSGLDTFHFLTPVLSSRNSALSQRNPPNAFKVVGNRFTVPQHLMGSRANLGVYDLRGKLLGKIEIGDRRVVDLSGFVKGRGVVVVRDLENKQQ